MFTLIASPSHAQFPFKGESGDDSNPYAYENYMFISPSQFPPSDLGDDIWKYSSKTACELYPPPHPKSINCDPINVNNNPQELFGVTGASIDKAWETSTGRPDVVIAVHDSGVRWDDVGAMNDLNNKTWLNRGELPIPDWGTGHSNDPYDRNADGVFNIKDYCPDWNDEKNCGGTGDSRVRGEAATSDTDYNVNGLIDPEDLIFKFSDGVDSDSNGYTDDFVGWDSYEDDNDPFDEVRYGHGTGEARDSTAELNNGGDAGVCPNCMVMHMRVGDSFIPEVNDFAEGVVYATDNGASVIQSALGSLNNSRFGQEAVNYAYRRGVVFMASAADESAGHHNQPSMLEHAVTVNSVGEPLAIEGFANPATQPRSYLDFRGCTNFGAYITAAVPSNSCSSEAVGRAAGMAGLLYSAARNEVARGNISDYGSLDGQGGVRQGRALSAEEVDQLIATSADDMDFFSPLPYDQRAGFPVPTERYPATTGWDPYFGYGRINADRMVRAVEQNMIPPEADITSPKWFALAAPGSGPVAIDGTVAARRAPQYSYEVEWGLWSWRDTNASPDYTTAGVSLTHSGNQSSPLSGTLATIDPEAISEAMALVNGASGSAGPGVDPLTGRGDHENRQFPDKFGVIVRLQVTARTSTGNELTNIDGQPLVGVGTKNFNFHDDPALATGFPLDLQGDGAASPRFADLDDDGADELIVATSNGEIHAYDSNGGEVPGWPVYTSDAQVNYGASAYQSGEITVPIHSATLRSPAVGDIDRDGDLEVIVADFQGRISAFDRHGSLLPGFPVRSDPAYSQAQRPDRLAGYYAAHSDQVPGDYRGPMPLPNSPDRVPDLVNRKDEINRVNFWFLAAPTLGNIDQDDELEILAGSYDRHLYAFNVDGTRVQGWPVFLRDPARLDADDSVDPVTHRVKDNESADRFNSEGMVVSPALGDLDGDGVLEILATVNEQYEETPNTDDPALPTVLQASGRDIGNNRLYAIYPDGFSHSGGPPVGNHPNPNAFVPGWPAKIASLLLEILPVVGNGPVGAPVIGNVNGGTDLEVGIYGTAGPGYVLGPDGSSIYGKTAGRDRTLLMDAYGPATNSTDAISVPAVGGAIFSRLVGSDGTGPLTFAAPSAAIGKLLEIVLPDDQLVSDNQLAVWDLSGTRTQLQAWPREVNDLQFLSTPGSADIDGDGFEELLNGTAYSDLHAFNFLGVEPGLATLSPTGWPKFTGGWTVGPPAVGDWGGDGSRDVAHTIREGSLFLWSGNGAQVCSPASWPEFGHDGWNTNNIETDAIRPGVITDLSASPGSSSDKVKLSWTAPGEDGPCGLAHSYEVRKSSNPITTDNFDEAVLIGGAPSPAAPGTTQSFEFAHPECETHVAIRTWDADPATDTPAHPANPSAISSSQLVGGPCADLSVTKTASPSPVKPGKNLTYTLTVTNSGPSDAISSRLSDTWTANIPGGATFISVSTSRGTCTKSAATSISCDLGTLAKGEKVTVTLVVRPKGTGTINNTATVASDTHDPQSLNNVATTSTAVRPG